MIASIVGQLVRVHGAHAELSIGPVVCDLLVPAGDAPILEQQIGQTVTFFTIFYLEGDASRGNLEPRLIGFLSEDDKQFFEYFTTVKGIGPKRALRALSRPVGEIAHAIESKDNRFLVQLPEIGKRTAEQIIAELAGKLGKFVASGAVAGGDGAVAGVRRTSRYSADEEDAIAALMALGERRGDAEQLLERAKLADPKLSTTDHLLREMLRLRTVRMG